MRLQYLGTAAAEGWPGIFCGCEDCENARRLGGRNIRTRSQAAVTDDNDNILLIDFPPDTYMHCLQHGLRLDKISHMVVTHSHHDHFAPSELMYRSRVFADPKDFTLHIYGNEATESRYRNMLADEWVLDEGEALGIQYHMIETFVPLNINGMTVTPLLALHNRKERCLIYMIEQNNKRILYGNDTGIFPEETWEYIKGLHFDIVSLDCTCGIEREGTNHMGLPDNIIVRDRLASLGCISEKSHVILHHFSHNGKLYYDAMVEKAKQYNMEVSYDGGVWVI